MELATGAIMAIIVGTLFVFRLPEVRECWNMHRRIRFYFSLSIIGIIVHMAVGVGGLLYVTWKEESMFVAVSWGMRNVHTALDTLVLYGALRGTSAGGQDTIDESASAIRGGSAEIVDRMYSGNESSIRVQDAIPSFEGTAKLAW